MKEPFSGNYNDLNNIIEQFEVVTGTIEQVNIQVEGLSLNADAEFDSKDFRNSCK
tara:strand:+ start:1771 stop:1935 length:165 start_codon:yes stop_codon:yes gene_type:complete